MYSIEDQNLNFIEENVFSFEGMHKVIGNDFCKYLFKIIAMVLKYTLQNHFFHCILGKMNAGSNR